MKVRLESFPSWRVTVERADVDPLPVVRWLSTTVDSGTGTDPLRTYLFSSRALETSGPCADVEGHRQRLKYRRCLKGRKDRRPVFKGRRLGALCRL